MRARCRAGLAGYVELEHSSTMATPSGAGKTGAHSTEDVGTGVSSYRGGGFFWGGNCIIGRFNT